MFEDFDFSVLDNPTFKEDSVREEIVAPILRKVGYTPAGELKVQRSKTLIHPFVKIGSKDHKVNIVPDYTLYFQDKPLLILDAKSPDEKLIGSENTEQAYSYAIHPEIRCEHYALCNGKMLVTFHINEFEPLAQLPIQSVNERWEDFYKQLHPKYLSMPELRQFKPDYGIHLKKSGISQSTNLILLDYCMQDIIKVSDQLYTSSLDCEENGQHYLISLDYTAVQLQKILLSIPLETRKRLELALSCQPFRANIDCKIKITCEARISELVRGPYEDYIPLIVSSINDAVYDPTARCE